jgi:uncharacterized protein
MRILGRVLAALALLGVVILGWGYWQATRDPIVRQARISLPDWPAGQAPVRVVLLSDIHVAGPDMPPSRLSRIVEQVNALRPDLVAIAGDMISDKALSTHHYPAAEAVAPLKGLRARFGVVAVLGNHDHWRKDPEFGHAVESMGATLLTNDAVRRGPLVIGGVDDGYSGHADIPGTIAAMDRLSGARVTLTHTPDAAPFLPENIHLLLSGHTHCGQIKLPFYGLIATASNYGERYACGHITEGSRTIMVGAGLGTSIMPLRYSVPPDLWLLTLGP